MSTRDELESTIEKVEGRWDDLDAIGKPPGSVMPSFERMLADALIAEGWRKKPTKAEVIEWALSHFGASNGTQVWVEFQGDADGLSDAILALMDGGSA